MTCQAAHKPMEINSAVIHLIGKWKVSENESTLLLLLYTILENSKDALILT